MSNILSKDENIKDSGIYLGYLVLGDLKNKEDKVSIFELVKRLNKKVPIIHYRQLVTTLVLLYSIGLIDFQSPNILFNKHDPAQQTLFTT